jgi:predicted permease
MSWIAIAFRLRALFLRGRMDEELREELDFHLEMQTRKKRECGFEAGEANRQARLQFGSVVGAAEELREQLGISAMEIIAADLRYALRTLKKSPGFLAVAVITMALAIGATTAIFSVVNSVLFRSLPFVQPNELVDISARSTLFDFPNLGLSLPDIADLRNSAASFVAIAVHRDSPKELSAAGDATRPQRLESTEVTEDFFPLLGIHPLRGRLFTSADMKAGNRAVILSYELWRGGFGADPNAIGQTIALDGQPYTIIGVIPAQPALGFATDSKLWTPFLPTPEELADRSNHAYSVVARLKRHVTVARAELELATISNRLASAYPNVDDGWSIHATSLKQNLLGDASLPLTILCCAVGFVLLIACANVSNLFLARGWARRREFAIRFATGASRAAVLRQLAVESLLVALGGGACAFLVVIWTTHALRLALPPDIPRLDQIRIDADVAWFALAASLLSALLAGLAPALLNTRDTLSEAIKPGFSTTSKTPASGLGSFLSHNLLRQLLIIVEIALASILLIGATVALRSFNELRHLDLGFRTDHLLTLRLDFPKFRFPTPEPAVIFVQQVLDTTRNIPGVSSVSAGLVYPMSDEVAETTFETETTSTDPRHAQQSALANRVTPDFFRTLGIPLVAGRDFTGADTKGKPPVFVVNETLAKKYFGGASAVGKRFSTDLSGRQPVWGEIVGIAGDVREVSHFDPEAESKPQVYAPFYQALRVVGVYLMVRSPSDPLALVAAIQDRIWSVDKSQPITAVATLDQRLAEAHAPPRAQTLLLGIFAGLGLLLALIGVYGVMSYLVGLQTREIGIHMALGASPAQVLHRILARGLKLTLAGVAIGTMCGLVLMRFMASVFFRITTSDPRTYATVALLLTTVALMACYIPARRATKVDPMTALRYE